MGKHSNTGLHQLREAFPKAEGWDVRGIGNHAAEVWKGMEYCGLVGMDKTTGKWYATHNMILQDGDPKFTFNTPKAAALNYYMKLPALAQPWLVAALQA